MQGVNNFKIRYGLGIFDFKVKMFFKGGVVYASTTILFKEEKADEDNSGKSCET